MRSTQNNLYAHKRNSVNALISNGFRMSLRSLEQEGIVTSFVQDLFPLGGLTVQHSFIGSWLWNVPAFLNRSLAMDVAAEAVALAYFARKIGSTEMLMQSRSVYANALKHLSIALKDSSLRLASGTLCATLLLIHYEVSMTGACNALANDCQEFYWQAK